MMRAENRKNIRRARWKVVAYFIPMMSMVCLGILIHHTVQSKHVYDLDKKKYQYNEIFITQAKKGILIDKIVSDLNIFRQNIEMSYQGHLNLQKKIYAQLAEIGKITPQIPDTALTSIRAIPAIYDSLITEIKLFQSTRDSVKTVNRKIKNQKYQLQECLNPESKKPNKRPKI